MNVIVANDSGYAGLQIVNEEIMSTMPAVSRREVKASIRATLKNDVGVVSDDEVVEITARDYSEEDGEIDGLSTRGARLLVDIEKYQRTYEVTQVWVPGNVNMRISTNGTVTVKDQDGNVIGAGNITDGCANITLDVPAGQQNITIEYPGDNTHNPANTTMTITVDKNKANITLDPIRNTTYYYQTTDITGN